MVDNPRLYRDVLDTIYDGVYFLDRQRKIFFWNKGAERITGYRAADVMGRSCADDILCHVDKQGRHMCREGCPAADVLNDGQRREAEVYLLHKNGYRKPVRIRVAPIEDASGRLEGVTGRGPGPGDEIMRTVEARHVHETPSGEGEGMPPLAAAEVENVRLR